MTRKIIQLVVFTLLSTALISPANANIVTPLRVTPCKGCPPIAGSLGVKEYAQILMRIYL
jgi:hypothetical protein